MWGRGHSAEDGVFEEDVAGAGGPGAGQNLGREREARASGLKNGLSEQKSKVIAARTARQANPSLCNKSAKELINNLS